jgi:hypothetical protein
MWRAFLHQVADPSDVSPALATFEDGWRAAVITDAIRDAAAGRLPVAIPPLVGVGG